MRRFIRKGISLKCLCAVLLVAMLAPLNVFAAEMEEGDYYTLTILHTNDIHGHVDQLPQYATIINQVRSQASNFLLLDGGDVMLRGEFESYVGQPELEILSAMGYDAWVLGNNDFRVPGGGTIEEGNAQLQKMIEWADYPTLCANVTMTGDGSYIKNVEPYTVKDVNGVNVGIIGVTTLKPQDRGWEEVSDKLFVSGEITVAELMDEVSEQSDVQIVLSHTGLLVDVKMASIDGVSAVLGADDHYIIRQPIYMDWGDHLTAPITQNGGEGEHYLGRLDLVYQMKEGRLVLVGVDGFLYDLTAVEEDTAITSIIERYRAEQEAAEAPEAA